MNNITKFIGLDVSKESIAAEVSDSGRSTLRYMGSILNPVEAIRKLIGQLEKVTAPEDGYEPRPTGYSLYPLLKFMDINCLRFAGSYFFSSRGQSKNGSA